MTPNRRTITRRQVKIATLSFFSGSLSFAVIANLTDFDRFVIGEVMAEDGRFDHNAMRSVFSYGNLLFKYCNRTRSRCVSMEVVRAINRFLLKVKFLQRSRIRQKYAKQ